MSTPTKPPLKKTNPAWNKMTDITAKARKPSISGLYFKLTPKSNYLYLTK